MRPCTLRSPLNLPWFALAGLDEDADAEMGAEMAAEMADVMVGLHTEPGEVWCVGWALERG